jgi:CheY-like chemotaxis protein
MGTEASAGGRDESKRMGGARADFVAGLGRKVAAARESLRAAVASPEDSAPREELGRRLHGLSTHAEILHFRALAEALRRARQLLAQAVSGPLGAEVAAGLVRLLDDAPKLAWDEAPPTGETPMPSSASGEIPTAITPFLPAVDEEPLEASVRLPLPPVEETRPLTFTPPAPPLREEVAAAERHEAPLRGDDADISLEGTPMLVADDDAGVTWYFADRLRAAGCLVHEALDGPSALAGAFATNPALVLLDIQMPGLDGLTLARALRRDIALRDVALFHTSWREDWLHRTRELSGVFMGALRKDAKTALVLARAREALRPRLRIGARIAAPGAVQGRLDGVTTHTLLQLVAAHRPDARIVVQDAAFRYELELRA